MNRVALGKSLRVGLWAGLVGGLVLGLGGRIVMRVLALITGTGGGFSVGGTLEVVLTGLVIGLPAALLFSVVRGFIPGSGWWKGPAFGAALLLSLVLLPPPAARSAAAGLGHLPLTVTLFGVLFVLYGLIVEAAIRRWTSEEHA